MPMETLLDMNIMTTLLVAFIALVMFTVLLIRNRALRAEARQVREEAESNAIRQALNQTDNNISHAAELLGVTRPTLYNLMRKYHIID